MFGRLPLNIEPHQSMGYLVIFADREYITSTHQLEKLTGSEYLVARARHFPPVAKPILYLCTYNISSSLSCSTKGFCKRTSTLRQC